MALAPAFLLFRGDMWTDAGRAKGKATQQLRMGDRSIIVRCPWLDCPNEIKTYRSQVADGWGGRRGRANVFCPEHRALVRRVTGESGRMNSYGRLFANLDRVWSYRSGQPLSLRVVAFIQYGERCANCRLPLLFSESGSRWFMDHTVPVYKGGQTTLRNLAPLCKECHKSKTRIEIKETRGLRPNTRVRHWHTHHQKDIEIAALKARIAELEARLTEERD